MNTYQNILSPMMLFNKIPNDKYSNVLFCLGGYVKNYEKKEIIYDYYECIDFAGIVLQGEVRVSMLNKSGAEHNMRKFVQGELFGEAYACVPREKSIMQIIAQKKSKILFLKFSKLFEEKTVHCPFASQVSINLLRETAKKNVFLTKKVEILTQKRIRDKIIVYLRSSKITGNTITLPFNRQEFADFLGVERSALSRELSRMKNEGLIDYRQNKITRLSDTFLSEF